MVITVQLVQSTNFSLNMFQLGKKKTESFTVVENSPVRAYGRPGLSYRLVGAATGCGLWFDMSDVTIKYLTYMHIPW